MGQLEDAMPALGGCDHPQDTHACDHKCGRFWCRVSRREPFETVEDAVDYSGSHLSGKD